MFIVVTDLSGNGKHAIRKDQIESLEYSDEGKYTRIRTLDTVGNVVFYTCKETTEEVLALLDTQYAASVQNKNTIPNFALMEELSRHS